MLTYPTCGRRFNMLSSLSISSYDFHRTLSPLANQSGNSTTKGATIKEYGPFDAKNTMLSKISSRFDGEMR